MANTNLQQAKKNKNDEFYTQLSDIENEMKHYKDFFKNKVVLCNCDDPRVSNSFIISVITAKCSAQQKEKQQNFIKSPPKWWAF